MDTSASSSGGSLSHILRVEKISLLFSPEVFKELMYSLSLVCWLILVGDVVILMAWIF